MSCQKKRLAVDLDKHARIDKFFDSTLKSSKVVRGKKQCETRTGRDYFAAARKREEARKMAAKWEEEYQEKVRNLKEKHDKQYIADLEKRVAELEEQLKMRA
jgi:hypothetical protein